MTDYKKYEPFFGTWYITRRIGAGSFGEVFEIEKQDRMLGKPSALKIIRIPHNPEDAKIRLAEGTTPEALSEYYDSVLRELEDEISIMSDLKGHSNIVSLEDYDVRPHEDGIGYDLLIKMELLKPLQQKMADMTMKDVVQLGIDMCTALDACHRKKIIHRDIKPSNIFLSSNGNYKLGDFGIARTMSNADTILSRKGTFNYMAPEIYLGNREYDMSVDIYSLGLVMYALLHNNRLPFAPPTSESYTIKSEQEALARRMRGEAFPELNVPKRLEAIIRKACAYRPEKRYTSADQMKRELEMFKASFFTEILTDDTAGSSLDSTLPLMDGTTSIEYPAFADATEILADADATEILADSDATEILTDQSAERRSYAPEAKPQTPPVPPVKASPVRKKAALSRRSIIIIACVAAVCVIGAIVAAVALLGGGREGLVNATVHADPANGACENAVILQVRNGKGNDTLTSVNVGVNTEGNEGTFTAYGCIPAGEEGLMAAVVTTETEPIKAEDCEITNFNFSSNVPDGYKQITAEINRNGDNVTMEVDHDEGGCAIEWNDDDFAKYDIAIHNSNGVSLSEDETVGVAVVYEDGKLSQGDVFYNQIGSVGAGSEAAASAVLPKELAENKNAELFILPRFEGVY